MSTKRKLNLKLDTSVLLTFQRLPYKAPYALAEFVDNAVQSYINEKRRIIKNKKTFKLKINIKKIGKKIEIHDNAAGISDDDLERALTPGKPPANSKGFTFCFSSKFSLVLIN